MPIFVRKPGPILRWSRVLHLAVAFSMTGYGGHLAGDSGCAIGAVGAVVAGLIWELATPLFHVKHPHADLWDLIAWLIGSGLASVGWALIGPG